MKFILSRYQCSVCRAGVHVCWSIKQKAALKANTIAVISQNNALSLLRLIQSLDLVQEKFYFKFKNLFSSNIFWPLWTYLQIVSHFFQFYATCYWCLLKGKENQKKITKTKSAYNIFYYAASRLHIGTAKYFMIVYIFGLDSRYLCELFSK